MYLYKKKSSQQTLTQDCQWLGIKTVSWLQEFQSIEIFFYIDRAKSLTL